MRLERLPELPLVSIVTPSFNQAAFLEQTIESVLSQDYPRIELLIIDGGSTDGSVDVIRRYEHRLAYWQSCQDGGQGDAINQGWRRASGDILAYLNSDDYYDGHDVVSRIVQAFHDHPEAGLVHGEGHWVNEAGRILQTSATAMPAQAILDDLVSLAQPAVFIRREVMRQVGLFDDTLHYALDKEYYLRVIGAFPFVSLPEALACLRLHDASKSVAGGMGFAPEMIRVAERICAAPEAYPLLRVDRGSVYAAAYQGAARFLYMGGRYSEAWRHLRRAMRFAPQRRWKIALREVPRILVRMLAGRRGYYRLSDAFRGVRLTGGASLPVRSRP